MTRTALSFFPLTLLALLGGAGLAVGTVRLFHNLWGALVVMAATSLLIATLFKLPPVWRAFAALLPLALGISLTQELPEPILLAAFAASALLYLPTLWTRVPFYPSARSVYALVGKLLPEKGPFRCIDLGCGFGTMISHLAAARPDGDFEGAEISPLPLALAKARSLARSNLSVRGASFWNLSLQPYDVVYAFLAPPPMTKLWSKARAEMKPGSRLIVNAFPVPEVTPSLIIEVPDSARQRLYVYDL